MPDKLPCPDGQILRSFLLGQGSASQSGAVEQHLEQCDRCVETLHALGTEDTLTEALRHGPEKAVLGSADDQVEGLIDRMCKLRPAGAAPAEDAIVLPKSSPPGAEADDEEAYDFLAPPQGPGEIGRLGGYRILKVLGSGGMGVVFQAEDPQLERLVALKAMKPALAASAAAKKRFLREAKSTAAIKHDHIVSIYQVGEDRGVPFLAMEFLQGEALDDRLKQEVILPMAEVVRIGRETAEGLAAAHESGLIHRDIKPGNIWLEGKRGRVKILDFGLARTGSDDAHLTKTGAIVGTPAYMAPEQAQGKPVDARCDLFSLGCVLYKLSTGRLPFEGTDTMSTLLALVRNDPKPPRELNPDVPAALSDLVMRLLAKDPSLRIASTGEVAAALENIERRPPAPGKSRPASRRRRWVAVAAVLVLALLPLGYFFGPAILRIATNKGQLVIETDSDDVEVVVKDRTGTLLDRKGRREITLKAGDYEMEVTIRDAAGKTHLFTKRFTIERGGRKIVDASLEIAEAEAKRAKRQRGQEQPEKGKVIAQINPPPAKDRPARRPAKARPRPAVKTPPAKKVRDEFQRGLLVLRPASLPKVQSWTIETRGHRDQVGSMAFSPDGRWLATLSRYYAAGAPGIRIWETATGRLVRTMLITGGTGADGALAWSSDGRYLAVRSGLGCVEILDANTGKPFLHIQSSNGLLGWSPKGLTLAVREFQSHGSKVVLYDAATGAKTLTLACHGQHFNGPLAWSPDGKRAAIAAWDKSGKYTVQVCDTGTGELLQTLNQDPSTRQHHGLSWSPDGKVLAVASGKGGTESPCVFLWNPATGKKLDTYHLPKGRQWNDPIHRFLGTTYHNVWDLSWAQKGESLQEPDFAMLVWQTDLGKVLRILASVNLLGARFSPDGKTFAVSDEHVGGTVRIKSAATGKILHTLEGRDNVSRNVQPSSDGKRLACFIFRREGKHTVRFLRIWDAGAGKLLHTLDKQETDVGIQFSWSPDNRTLATWSAGEGKLWDTHTGKPLNTLPAAEHLVWSPDGKHLAFSYKKFGRFVGQPMQHVIKIWDVAAGKISATLQGSVQEIRALVWRPGKIIGINQDYGPKMTPRFWDAEFGQELRDAGPARNQPQAITLAYLKKTTFHGVSFSPDGQLLISQSGIHTELRKTDTDELLSTIIFLDDDRWAAVSADGHYRGTPGIERDLIYLIQTGAGQEMLRPAEFGRRFDWKNDPARVKLSSP